MACLFQLKIQIEIKTKLNWLFHDQRYLKQHFWFQKKAPSGYQYRKSVKIQEFLAQQKKLLGPSFCTPHS